MNDQPSENHDDWIQRLKSPRTQAKAIQELNQRLVRGIARSLSRRSGHGLQAEDIAQEALLRILESLDDFRGECQFPTWALTIANRMAISELRRKHYQDVSLEDVTAGEGLRIEPAAKHDSINARLDREMLEFKLSELIESRLTDKQQTAVRALLGGMPIEEVAKRMDSNRNAIYKLFHDARTRLKLAFEQSGIQAEEVHAVLA